MLNYKKINNIAGWAVFAIATIVYLLTVERTASFWDCGEFIAASYKLQVPHPPGAPLFLLIGRMFSFLALGDVTKVAYWINVVSVLSSSFTILFMFWSITMLAKKVVAPKNNPDLSQLIGIIGSGVVGALAYTFSDSFWFSAVEAEVYAISSFFTAFVLIQLVDLGFYLMNQSDTFVFNLGVAGLTAVFVALGYLGLYLMKVVKPEKEEVKQEKEE